jgi:outer membrane immunogenic protein
MSFKSTVSLCAIIGLTVASGAARAADLPGRAYTKAAAISPATNWSGFYVGGQLGGASLSTRFHDPDDFFDNEGLNAERNGSFTGGAYGGYNWQFGSFVVGLDAQWSWYDLKSSGTNSLPEGRFDVSVRDAGSVKARFGLAFTDTLVYVAAGPAWANSTFTVFDDVGFAGSNSELVGGYAAAIGVEHMVTGNWIVRGQVQYSAYDSQRVALNDIRTSSMGHSSDIVEATVGLSYKFGSFW